MTSPPDVQNVPDVWGLLKEALDYINCQDNIDDGADLLKRGYVSLSQRDRFVLVPKEPVAWLELNRDGSVIGVTLEPDDYARKQGIVPLVALPKPPGKP